MLRIRQHQMDALARAPRIAFENKLIRHCSRFYPDECATMGQDQLRALVRYAIERSTEQGFRLEREIAYFLSLMFELGVEFDRDPQLPWNFDATSGSPLAARVGTMHVFFKNAMAYVDDITGSDNEHLIQAMRRMHDFALTRAPPLGVGFDAALCEILRHVSPRKFAYQGETVTLAVIQTGAREAARYGITDNQGLLTYTILLFMVGSGMSRDPIHGWIGTVLNDPTMPGGAIRGRHLFMTMNQHIAGFLKSTGHVDERS